MTRPVDRLFTLFALALGVFLLVGCQNSAQTGALAGAGLGALAGQAIGGNTEGTLIGAAVGGGLGYAVGNEQDKQRASAPPTTRSAPSQPRSQTGPLSGSRWRLISLNPSDLIPPYASKVVEFTSDGRVITTTTGTDGSVALEEEAYRVVGDTLVITSPDNLVNARFDISGGLLTISAEDFSAVLEGL